jgi:purine nucleoside permease
MPSSYHHVRLNGEGVLGMVRGVGTAKAAASVMALGMDPRLDLSKAYWLVAGIGAVIPKTSRLDPLFGLSMSSMATFPTRSTEERSRRTG